MIILQTYIVASLECNIISDSKFITYSVPRGSKINWYYSKYLI